MDTLETRTPGVLAEMEGMVGNGRGPVDGDVQQRGGDRWKGRRGVVWIPTLRERTE
jgi:hypothetical protein